MAYLNANIPVEYAQIRRKYLYDLKSHHGEVEDCIIFGLSHPLQVSLFFFTLLWRTVRSFIGYQLQLLYNVASNLLTYLGVDWMSFSFGIVLVIIPSVHTWDILEAQAGKYIGKDKKWHLVNIYLQLTLPTLKVIY